MRGSNMLGRRLTVSTAILFAAQAAILGAVWIGFGLRAKQFMLSAGTSAAYHVLLGAFLLWRLPDFRLLGSPELLQRVNIANELTMARLSSIPTAVFMIVWSREISLLPAVLPFLILVFATDFLDGIFARRRGEITVVGRYLDSVSDYLIIIATSVIFFIFRLVPLWFFILITARLVLFALGMGYAALKRGKANTLSTFMGKASIFAVMTLYVMEVAESFRIPWIGNATVVRIVEFAAAAIVAASLVDKAIFLQKLLTGRILETDPQPARTRGGDSLSR